MKKLTLIALLLLVPQLAMARVYMCVDQATGDRRAPTLSSLGRDRGEVTDHPGPETREDDRSASRR